MPTTTISIQHQRPSCSKQTQLKAARLEVLDLTQRLAIVQGDHGEYYVDMYNVICSCRAGRDGLRCSHAMSALIERSRMQGYGDVTFHDDRLDARAACVAHLRAGRRARLVEEAGYIWVEAETSPPPPKPTRRWAAYDARTKDLAVWESGKIIGHCRTYLEAESIHA